jgi:hypothetical protein
VIAFEKNLTASAGAHHPVTELVETGIVASAEEKKDRQDNEGELGTALCE